jgi:3-hydroxymyristoyl/3-hydroxydecanoyl-(acyl carrier protein) dehydratase
MIGPMKLPHAYPFRFIPREDCLEFSAAADDDFVRGGIVSPWVVLEALTQAAGLALAGEGSTGGSLVQVSRYRSVRPVRPGDRLQIRAVLLKRMGPLLRVRVTALREGRLAAAGILTLRETSG